MFLFYIINFVNKNILILNLLLNINILLINYIHNYKLHNLFIVNYILIYN